MRIRAKRRLSYEKPDFSQSNVPRIWKGKLLHLGLLLVFLGLVWQALTFLGCPFPAAFWTAISFPVIHQIFVWVAWRLELAYSATSRVIGFPGYMGVFFVLFGGRFVSLALLAWLDRGSLGLVLGPQLIITVPMFGLGIYAMYSVIRFFGMDRASGADHFDPKYRNMPLVNRGIFRFTNNGMYLYAFFLFWAIAIGSNSSSALLVAAFSHAYIWVHFYATEKPDMEYIYGSRQ
jgi:hypothetical protein